MISDLITKLHLYEAVIPGATSIEKAFLENNPKNAPCEVREKSYALKEADSRRFEVHFHTIDLMIAREGGEVINITKIDNLVPAEKLPNGNDGQKLDGPPQGLNHTLKAGYFVAIFPGEAHMVGGKLEGENSISKWVVKVPCTEEFKV
ncbi:MAG: YhcH/YjgK/YiaL family protein [Sphaerochaetaceae bacterium]|nr:YhcH/YjgK/YiaL family protein [Sphaerochaetaceae bacterium]